MGEKQEKKEGSFMNLFERPCPAGWVYPCTIEEISDRLSRVAEAELKGLWAIGLVPATRRNDRANAGYLWGEHPVIHLYSHRETLRYKLPPYTRPHHITKGFAVECAYGMKTECIGSRYICCWALPDLRRFILEHVLLHEIGHHVYHRERKQQGFQYRPHTRASEQFAEAYALRYCPPPIQADT